ncbi:hypothetical protein HYW99_02365 [Candidatus Woesearchaeota archaeon]|nr:hypothetical protein [Candidatus Woesearchaeota archaeon]
MGFLKFLKREKKRGDLEELDLPPAPPPIEDFEKYMELPDFGEEKIPGLKEEFPEFDFEKKGEDFLNIGIGEIKPEVSLPEEEKSLPPQLSEPFKVPEMMPLQPLTEVKEEPVIEEMEETTPEITSEIPKTELYQETGAMPFTQRKELVEQDVKSIYVKVDNFKATLGIINIVRNDLKKSDDLFMKLESIKVSKDKNFDRIKFSLEDLQKKLIFIDKTLFKGE